MSINLDHGAAMCSAAFGNNSLTSAEKRKLADTVSRAYDDAFALATEAESGEFLGGGRHGEYFKHWYKIDDRIVRVEQYSSGDNEGAPMGFLSSIEKFEEFEELS